MNIVAAKFSELAGRVSLPKTHKKAKNMLSLPQSPPNGNSSDEDTGLKPAHLQGHGEQLPLR